MSLIDIPIDKEQLSVCIECGAYFVNIYTVIKLTGKDNECELETYEALEDKCCKCGGYFQIAEEESDSIS